MTDPPISGMTFLYRTALTEPAGRLFPRLLNDLCGSEHTITSAELRQHEIRIALDGHLFVLHLTGRCAALSGSHQLCRPGGPMAGLAGARLGLAVLRHKAALRIELPPECPDTPAATLLRTLGAVQRPAAVLWEASRIVLTATEALRAPLSGCAALTPGVPLPRPVPRYDRPGALPEAAARSVFACHRARTRSGAPAPRKAPRASGTEPPAQGPAPSAPAEGAAPSAPARGAGGIAGTPAHRSVFGHDLGPSVPGTAVQRNELRSRFHAANQPTGADTSGAGLLLLLPSPVCDGLTFRGPQGGKRTIGTTLLALALFSGALGITLGPVF